MTQMTTDLSLAEKLRALDLQIDDTLRRAKRRNMISLVLSLIVLALIAYWLWYAHGRFTRQATPETFAGVAQARLVEYMPAASVALEEQLKDRAPELVDQGVDRLRTMPDQFADRLTTELSVRMDSDLPRLEQTLYEHLSAGVKQARATVDQAHPTGTDDQKFKAMLEGLAVVYEQESSKLITQAYDTYTKHATEILAYLEFLAEGKGLTRRDQLHRDMVRSVLALLAHHKDQAGAQETAKPAAAVGG